MTDAAEWAGKRLGLPETGSRSIARFGRRLGGIAIDWALTLAIAVVFFHYNLAAPATLASTLLTLGIFAVLQVVFIAIFAGSIGHLIVGLRLVPLKPSWVGVWRPAVRSVLLCLVVPAFIWDKDQRGLHDKVAGTVLVRR